MGGGSSKIKLRIKNETPLAMTEISMSPVRIPTVFEEMTSGNIADQIKKKPNTLHGKNLSANSQLDVELEMTSKNFFCTTLTMHFQRSEKYAFVLFISEERNSITEQHGDFTVSLLFSKEIVEITIKYSEAQVQDDLAKEILMSALRDGDVQMALQKFDDALAKATRKSTIEEIKNTIAQYKKAATLIDGVDRLLEAQQFTAAVDCLQEALQLTSTTAIVRSVIQKKAVVFFKRGENVAQKAWKADCPPRTMTSYFSQAKLDFQRAVELHSCPQYRQAIDMIDYKLQGNELCLEARELEKRLDEERYVEKGNYTELLREYKNIKTKYESAKLKFVAGAKLDSNKFQSEIEMVDKHLKLTDRAISNVQEELDLQKQRENNKDIVLLNVPETVELQQYVEDLLHYLVPEHDFTGVKASRLGSLTNTNPRRPIEVILKGMSITNRILEESVMLSGSRLYRHVHIRLKRTGEEWKVINKLKCELKQRQMNGENYLKIKYSNGCPYIG